VEEDNNHFTVEQDYAVGCISIVGRYPLTAFGARAVADLTQGRPYVVCDIDQEYQDEADLAAYRYTQIQAVICISLVKNDRMVGLMAVHQTTPRSWTQEEIELVEMVGDQCWAIIERARADRRLREANAELERRVEDRTAELRVAVNELEGFTYSVSHDLRAPLRAIVSSARILQEDCGHLLPEESKAILSRQATNANKLGTLIDDLLKLSRLSRQELRKETFDLTAVAFDVVEELSPRGVRIQIAPGMQAFGDPKLVRFVLLNLVENACKFSPAGGTVLVGVEPVEGGHAFFVRDQGIGLDMQYAHKVFLPFERLVLDTEFPGTGIGLANVQRIVQRHGGRVWVDSQPGQGATFYFTLG